MSKLNFRVSSALKDIIGRDLITDDNIAIFELVKNSYDAHANRVDVIFDNIYDLNKASIIIKDNGKGMDYNDLKNKWLFVAYSAKKEGSEDKDYRDKIYQNRQFAGAKGIGRFSCDRLGKKLRLESTKKGGTDTEILLTDWENFEKNIQDQFMEIEVKHSHKKENSFGLKNGTALKITELRSNWDGNKITKLKESLAKLINPSDNKGKNFEIFLTCIEEGIREERVENFIFEALEIKTTKILVDISEDGENITTELRDGGTLIYKLKEKNTYNPKLQNISVKVFYLNKAAKLTFGHRMGINTRNYGSIFLYKNDIRIYPYGEPGEDPLKLDSRKAQKPSIYIGNKDLIGRIEISGKNNSEFKETSSRGDGFIKNPTYNSFLKFIEEKVISRLEKYVIDVQKWGDGSFLSIEDSLDNASEDELKIKITNLISKLTDNNEIIDVEYGDDLLGVIDQSQSESVTALIKNLFRLAKNSGNDKLLEVANKTEKKVAELFTAFSEINNVAVKATKELEEKESQNLFLKSLRSQDLDEVVSFMHSIGISASTIDNYLSALYQKINRGIPIEPEKLKNIIEIVSFENRKILSITRFATKANFKLYAEDSRLDLIEFIKEYAINILAPLRSEDILISIRDNYKKALISTFKPIEISILLDNLLSNSIRAKAKRFIIEFTNDTDDSLVIKFIDDGIGISHENISKIFDFGFTTTSGSGLGLFHVRDIAQKLHAEIVVNNKIKKGVEFQLIINKI